MNYLEKKKKKKSSCEERNESDKYVFIINKSKSDKMLHHISLTSLSMDKRAVLFAALIQKAADDTGETGTNNHSEDKQTRGNQRH